MKKLTATIFGIVLVGTLATACSSEPDPNSWEAIRAAQDAKPEWQKEQERKDRDMQWTCDYFRDSVHNYSVKTYDQRQKSFEMVYSYSMQTDFSFAGRQYYESWLSNDGDLMLSSGRVLAEACQNVPGL